MPEVKVSEAMATVSNLPSFSGDGYGYGGSSVVTIGERSFLIGETSADRKLAKEIANRWNAGPVSLDKESGR